jgi:hypothetical protein
MAATVKMLPLVNKGLVLALDPRLLTEGQLQEATNVLSLQEGSICTRSGSTYVTNIPPDLISTIRKLRVSDSDTSNPRYIGALNGASSDIIRTKDYLTYAGPGIAVGDVADFMSKRWSMAAYSAGTSGDPWAFFACPNKMLKDKGKAPIATLPTWGILPAFGVATAVSSGAPGLLDTSPGGALPYRYRYTYKSASTGNEGNPSREMTTTSQVANGVPLSITLEQALVHVWGTADTTEFPSIMIYREGGLVGDGLYHLVGSVTNTGYGGAGIHFTDNVPDIEAIYGKILETDNDPPIPSGLPTPFSTTCSAVAGTGFQTVTVGAATTDITPGSTFYFFGGDIGGTVYSSEQATVVSTGVGTVTCYCQNTHGNGERVEVYIAVGHPAHLCCAAFDSVFVAGDPNNRHALYKSKTAMPEAFPQFDAAGNAHVTNVGTPSNYIVNLCEFNGVIACLNVSGIFEVQVWQGVMQAPIQTPASRGLHPLAPWAWCKANNEIFYLSYDGIYSWSGGASVKRSEAINSMFQGKRVGSGSSGVYPIDFSASQIQYATMEFYNGRVYMNYRATDGSTYMLVYDVAYDRWHKESFLLATTTLYNESDIGRMLVASADAYGGSHIVQWDKDGTYDPVLGPFNVDDDGSSYTPIPFRFRTGFFDMGDPSLMKLVTAVYVDLENPAQQVGVGAPWNDIICNVYYDYDDTTVAPDSFTIPASVNKSSHLVCIPLNPGGLTPGDASYGKECRSIALEFLSAAGVWRRITLHSVGFEFAPVETLRQGGSMEYSNLGYDGDKKLYVLKFTYDTGANDAAHQFSLHLDTRTGIDGKTENLAVQSWTLSNLGKTSVSLPLNNDPLLTCKLVRLRTDVTLNTFRTWQWEFVKEEYPPDIVYHTPLTDSGYPFDKYYQQVRLDVDTGGVAASVIVEIDGVDQPAFSVTTTSSDRHRNVTMAPSVTGRKARLKITPGVGGKFQLFTHDFGVLPADKGPVTHTYDWDDLGHPWDKRLETVTVDYEVTAATTVKVDILSGITGAQAVTTAQIIDLKTAGRHLETFPMPVGTIAKMVRLYPTSTNAAFKEWKYRFKQENYPPDVVYQTEPTDSGYVYDKYYQQVDLEVDTNGVAASVTLMVDGTARFTFPVTSTITDRHRNLTMPPDVKGKRAHLEAVPGTAGKFQLFNHSYIVLPADKGPVMHSWDWNALDWPYDKRLEAVTIEYEVTADTTVIVDGLSGIAGNQSIANITTINLYAGGRRYETFSMPNDTIVKMVRLYPSSTNVNFKEWKYDFKKENYPADTIPATPWDQCGYPWEKILRAILLKVDTGGVNCSVDLQVDGVSTQTFVVNGTANDRERILTPNRDIIGKMFRLVATPGTGGKFQMFKYYFDVILEPAPLTIWDSQEQTFGLESFKSIKQIWVQYMCESPITLLIYTDGGALFYTKSLPAHTKRDVERFYLPAKSGTVLNISKAYRFVALSTTTNTFKLYVGGSRVSWVPHNADQRQAYQQTPLFTEVQLGEGGGVTGAQQ